MDKGDASMPQERMSAYDYFVLAYRAEQRNKYPTEVVLFEEFKKDCRKRWMTLNEKERQRFQIMTEKDKKRFALEMADKPIKRDKSGKKRKRAKDPNAPKRALPAFLWFCNDERAKVKETMPDSGVVDVAKELGKRWGTISGKEKAKYEALAAKDKARYTRQSNAYKKKPKIVTIDDSDHESDSPKEEDRHGVMDDEKEEDKDEDKSKCSSCSNRQANNVKKIHMDIHAVISMYTE